MAGGSDGATGGIPGDGAPQDGAPSWPIRPLLAEFADPEVEHRYRRRNLAATARQLSAFLLFGGPLFPLFAIPDFVTSGVGQGTIVGLAGELMVAIVAVWFAIRVRRDPEAALEDSVITGIEGLAMSVLLLVTVLRPQDVETNNLTMAVLVLALCVFIPNRMPLAVGVCAGGVVSYFALSWTIAPEGSRVDPKSAMALVVITMVGAWVANLLGRSHREEFASIELERWSNEQLIAEITLRKAAEEELKWVAEHDALTDLLNRRAFFEAAERELARGRRSGHPVSVLVLDADRFKNINDTYGHHTGDEAIRLIARCCKSHLRADDVVGRLGGEEFAIVMPATDLQLAHEIAARVRERIAMARLPHPEGEVSVTVSVGATECRLWQESLQDALQRADAAMYEAKSSGRDRVVVAAAG